MKSKNASTPEDTSSFNETTFYQWVMDYRLRGIHFITRICSDFSQEDAEDVFSILVEQLVKHGPQLLGKPSPKSLFRHLRRAKENFRHKRGAKKRGSQFEHIDLSEYGGHLSISNESDIRQGVEDREILNRLLNNLPPLSEKENIILKKILELNDAKVPDLYDLMTDKERLIFAPKKRIKPSNVQQHIVNEIHRARSKLRKRLKKCRYLQYKRTGCIS